MIKQIQGTDLSGITAKPTKGGKNSLFAKLLAMLEKQTEASGKSKGFQLQTGKTKSGKSPISLIGLTALTEKSDPFLLNKSKHILTLATKAKENVTDETETSGIPLLTAQVIIDSNVQLKKTGKNGVSNNTAGDVIKANTNDLSKGSEKVDQGNVLLDKMAQAVTGKQADMLASQAKGSPGQVEKMDSKGQQAELKSALLTANKADVAVSPGQLGRQSEQLMKAPQISISNQADSVSINGSESKLAANATDRMTENRLFADPKAAATTPIKPGKADKAELKASAEVMSLAAAIQTPKSKALQPQQVHQQLSPASVISSASQMNISDASLADSGSQSSDQKGGQEARLLNAVMTDAKSTSSSSSIQNNFQNYLTSKTAPPMSIFDSMNHIAQSAKNGQTKIEIQLDPANLGKIHISLQADASKQLQIHMIVDQSMTRAALEQQLPQLRSALAQQGFDLSGFSMDSQDQQTANGGEDNKQGSQHNNDQLDTALAAFPANTTTQTTSGSGLSIRV